MDIDISEIHNKAIDEYIDSILSSEGLIYPFINKEMAQMIARLAKEMFLQGYIDAIDTDELIKSEDSNTQIGTVTSFGLTENC